MDSMNQNSKLDYASPTIRIVSLIPETAIVSTSDFSGNIDPVPVHDWPPLN